MNDNSKQIDAIQELAQTVIDVAQVDVPELEVTDEMIVEEEEPNRPWIETEQDEEWWDAWCEIHDIVVAEHGAPDIPDNRIRPDVEPHRRYDSIKVSTEWTSLVVKVYASGRVNILAEYDNGSDGSWAVLVDEDAETIDPLEVGRDVASAELTILTHQTQSAVETLDYWQTELSPRQWRQRKWADVRGVGNQAVSNAKTSAEAALTPNTIDAIETVVVDPDDVVEAIEYNRDEADHGRKSAVLRISPPFNTTVTASVEYVQEGHYYPPDMSPKPIHVVPAKFAEKRNDVLSGPDNPGVVRDRCEEEMDDPTEADKHEWVENHKEIWRETIVKKAVLEEVDILGDLYNEQSDETHVVEVEYDPEVSS